MHWPCDKNTPISADYDYHLQNEKGYARDFACKMGDELYAVVSGSVERFYTWWGGTDTLILHGDNGEFYLYAHCLDTVRTGRVNEGDVIAHAGNDGNSTGPHLHFAASRDYNHLKAYSTSLEKDYIEEVFSSGRDEEMLLKFTGAVNYYNFEGKHVGQTADGYYGKAMRSQFFDGWWIIEFTFGTFWMKDAGVQSDYCFKA